MRAHSSLTASGSEDCSADRNLEISGFRVSAPDPARTRSPPALRPSLIGLPVHQSSHGARGRRRRARSSLVGPGREGLSHLGPCGDKENPSLLPQRYHPDLAPSPCKTDCNRTTFACACLVRSSPSPRQELISLISCVVMVSRVHRRQIIPMCSPANVVPRNTASVNKHVKVRGMAAHRGPHE